MYSTLLYLSLLSENAMIEPRTVAMSVVDPDLMGPGFANRIWILEGKNDPQK